MESPDVEMDDTPVYGELIVFGREGNEQGRFPMQTDALMGRCQDSDIRVRRPDVSREHAMLSVENQRVWLTQLSKTNPTRVNNKPVGHEPVCLRDGDMVHISDRRFQFVYMNEYKHVPTPERLETVPQSYQGSQDYSSLEQTLALDSVLKERNVDTSQTPKSPAARKSFGSTGKQSLQTLREKSQSLQEQREERFSSLNSSMNMEDQSAPQPAPQVVENEQDSFIEQGSFQNTPRHQFFEDNSPTTANSTGRLKTPLKQDIESKRQSYGAKSVHKTEEAPVEEEEGAESSDIEILDENNANQAEDDGDKSMDGSAANEESDGRADSAEDEAGNASDEQQSETSPEEEAAEDEADNASDEQQSETSPEELADEPSDEQCQFANSVSKVKTPLKQEIEQRRQSYGAKSSYKYPSDAAEPSDSGFEDGANEGLSGRDVTEEEGTATESSQEEEQEAQAQSKLATPLRKEIQAHRQSYGCRSTRKPSENENDSSNAETDKNEEQSAKAKLATPLRTEIQKLRKSSGAKSSRKASRSSTSKKPMAQAAPEQGEMEEEESGNEKLATPVRNEIQQLRKSYGAKTAYKGLESASKKSGEHKTAPEQEEMEEEEDAGNEKLATPVRNEIQQLRKSYGAKSAYKGLESASEKSTRTPKSRKKSATPRSRRTPGKSPASAVVSVGKLFSASNENDIENYQSSSEVEGDVDTSIRKALATPIREAIRSRRQSSASSSRSGAVQQVNVSEHFDEEEAQCLQEAGVTSYSSLHSEKGNVHLFFGEEGEVIRSVIEPSDGLFTEADQLDNVEDQGEYEQEEEEEEIDWENLSSEDISSLILNGYVRMDPALQDEIAEAGTKDEGEMRDHNGMHSRFAARKSMGLNQNSERPNDHKFFEDSQERDQEQADVDMGAQADDVESSNKDLHEERDQEQAAVDMGAQADDVESSNEDSHEDVGNQDELGATDAGISQEKDMADEAMESSFAEEQPAYHIESANEEEATQQETGEQAEQVTSEGPTEEDESDVEEGELCEGETAEAGAPEHDEDQAEEGEYDSDEGCVFSPELETISESEVETDVGTTPGRFSMSARYSTPGFQNRHSTASGKTGKRYSKMSLEAPTDTKRRRTSTEEYVGETEASSGEAQEAPQKDVDMADEGVEEVSQENHHPENQSETGQHVAFSSGDLHKRTVPQLRELAQSYGLSSEGKKRDLIERILSLSTSSEQGEGEVAEQPTQEETVDYSKLTVTELRKELTARGLPTNGKKQELVSRLQDGVAVPSEAETIQGADAMENQAVADYSSWTVSQLRDKLQKLGMSTKGKKADLVERLQEAPSSASEDAESTPNPSPEDLGSMKVNELRQMLQEKGMDTSGKKAELIERLTNPHQPLETVEEEAPKQETEDYSALKVAELKQRLRQYGLNDNGRKAELIDRLQEHEAGSSQNGDSAVDIDSMTVAELRDALKSRGIDSSGRKAQLIQRLKQAE